MQNESKNGRVNDSLVSEKGMETNDSSDGGTRGGRLPISPSLFLPFTLSQFFSLSPQYIFLSILSLSPFKSLRENEERGEESKNRHHESPGNISDSFLSLLSDTSVRKGKERAVVANDDKYTSLFHSPFK